MIAATWASALVIYSKSRRTNISVCPLIIWTPFARNKCTKDDNLWYLSMTDLESAGCNSNYNMKNATLSYYLVIF